MGVFHEYLGIPSVMMGFGLPDDNLHAPNEKFHLPNFYRGMEVLARYLELLGKLKRALPTNRVRLSRAAGRQRGRLRAFVHG